MPHRLHGAVAIEELEKLLVGLEEAPVQKRGQKGVAICTESDGEVCVQIFEAIRPGDGEDGSSRRLDEDGVVI